MFESISWKMTTNFSGINVPKDGVERDTFTNISIDSLLVYEKKYNLQVYLDNCACKIIRRQMAEYLDDHHFDSDEN